MNTRKLLIMVLLLCLVLVPLAERVPDQAVAQDSELLPLTEPGPYTVGTRDMTFIDENRNRREILVTLWYPALEAAEDSVPDFSDAPYPLILYSHGHGGRRNELEYLTQHLASYGFFVAAMEQKGHAGDFVTLDVIDQPMDVLFVLDQLAALSEGNLVGAFDSNNTGVAGYSGGGYDAIMVSGAQWDDMYHWEWCAEHPADYIQACSKAEQIPAYRAQFGPVPAEGELWPPMTDDRIKAVLPLTGGPGMVFGERGLALATVPVLLIAGTADTRAPYEWAGVFVYDHWGANERYLISVIGGNHQFGYGPDSPNRHEVMHFATAFFGYFLQGREDYAQYLTADYVNSLDGLAWGPYQENAFLLNLKPITPDNVDQIEQLATFEQGTVCSATFSDGNLLAASGIGTVVLRDGADGSILDTLATQYGNVFRMALSLDAKLVAATSMQSCGETTIQVWDIASGNLLLQQLDGVAHMATGVTFNPDGTLVAVGTGCAFGLADTASVKVWNIASGTLVLDIAHPAFVRDVAFSPDGTLLASASSDDVVRLWDAETGALRSELYGRSEYVSDVAFSPDGSKLAVGSWGESFEVWDVATEEQRSVFEGLAGNAMYLTYSMDGQLLVTGGPNKLLFWSTATDRPIAERTVNPVYSLSFNADNTLLATCSHDRTLRLWGIVER